MQQNIATLFSVQLMQMQKQTMLSNTVTNRVVLMGLFLDKRQLLQLMTLLNLI
jgi:hypothetical protein